MSDPQIFESLTELQTTILKHVVSVRREHAKGLRELSGQYRQMALLTYDSTTEQARLEGMGDAFAIAADLVDVGPRLEAVK